MSYLRHIERCNNRDISAFAGFYIGRQRLGWIRRSVLKKLRDFPEVFQVEEDRVALHSGLATPESRTRATAEVCQRLVEAGLIPRLRGEDYRVTTAWSKTTEMLLDRGAVPFFGVRAYGVHLNGVVGAGADQKMWIGRRAPNKTVAPGKLDNVVAGGQPAGLTLRQNLIKEAWEEAGLPERLITDVRCTGALTYTMEVEYGLRVDTLFVYDFEFPDDVTPRSVDGEMSEFMLWPVDRVLRTVRESDDFKFNVPLVLIDYGIRHGWIDPDLEPDYSRLIAGLHRS